MEVFDALACWIQWLAKMIFFYVVEGAEFILESLALAATALLSLLPELDLPEPNADSGVVGALNYVVPLDLYMVTATAILTAWIAYKVLLWGLRWAKAEE